MSMLPVNVYAEDLGWLFEDLKRHFLALDVHDQRVVISDRPLADAAAWVVLRTKEAGLSPDLQRTAVCVHDLFNDDDSYSRGGSRGAVWEAGALVLCHPEQRQILAAAGVPLEGRKILERPLGALSIFQPRHRMPEVFTAGWVGKNHPRKRLSWFVEAMLAVRRESAPLRAVLIGEDLGDAAARLRAGGVECLHYAREVHPITDYPRLYHEFDALVITGTTEAGPLPLFEALASGLPVVSTPVGWAPHFARASPAWVYLAQDPAGITAQLETLRRSREELFEQRSEISRTASAWRLEEWVRQVLELARSLA
jgi:glycosyltransferase involved in cell wall biosynthesis